MGKMIGIQGIINEFPHSPHNILFPNLFSLFSP